MGGASSATEPAGAGRTKRPWLIRLALGWLLLVCALGGYWVLLHQSHREQLVLAEDQARLRATQTAEALTMQVGALIGGVDYMAHHLSELWFKVSPQDFRRAAEVVEAALPAGALLQVSVVDGQGQVVFSSLEPDEGRPAEPLSIADRDHFKVHFAAAEPRLYISHPIKGRLSGRWSIQFSRPILSRGKVSGVIVLSLSPDYIARSLHRVFPDAGDVVALLRDDGHYLARTHRGDEVLGQQVDAAGLERLRIGSQSGAMTRTLGPDPVERYYTALRVPSYPVVVVLGLSRAAAIASVDASMRGGIQRNLIGSALLILAAASISWLYLRGFRQGQLLRDSRERLALAMQGADLGSWDWNVPSGRVRFNTRWAQMIGYDLSEVAPDVSSWETLVHPDDMPAIQAALDAHFRGETAYYETEHRMRHRDGHWVWVLDRGRVMSRDDQGRPLRMVGTHLDISVRKEAEAIQLAWQQRLSKLVAHVPGMVYQYLLRPDGTSCFPYVSPGVTEVYRSDAASLAVSAEPVFALIHAEDIVRVTFSIQQSAERLETWRCDYRVCYGEGEVRWLSGEANPERLEDGSTLWHGYLHDVTAERLAAEALARSEERLRLTVGAVKDGLWEWDMRTGALHWDARCYEMLGHVDGGIPMSFERWTELLHPADRERTLAGLHEQITLHPERVAHDDFRMRTAEGAWLWVEGRGSLVDWEDGRPTRMIGTYTDISTRVAEARLRRALLDQSAAAIVLTSRERRIQELNGRAAELFALPGQSLVGADLRGVHVDEHYYEAFADHYPDLRETGRLRIEYPLRDVHGQVRWFDIDGTLLDPDQPEGDVIWTLVDITERYFAEQQLAAERVRLTTLLQRFPGGVLMVDAGNCITLANQTLCDLLGLDVRADSLVGRTPDELASRAGAVSLDWLRSPSSGQETGAEMRCSIEVSVGEARTLEIDRVPIERAQENLGHVWLVRDISERKQRERTLARLATTDALTGLPNRRTFMTGLECMSAGAGEDPSRPGTLLMLDIDHFKRVNDRYGHPVGDRVLQHVAELIRASLREDDLAARLGGEEFAVLLPRTSIDRARGLAERLRAAIASTPAQTDEGAITVRVSIGLSEVDGCAAKLALRRADEALYIAKGCGRDRVKVWAG